MHLRTVLTAGLLCTVPLALGACAPAATTTVQASPQAIELTQDVQRAAARFAVTGLRITQQGDGSTLVGGRLNGRAFAAKFPPNWNRQAALYAHGYQLPSDKPDTVPGDPVQGDVTGGLLPAVYADGFAVAQSVYDKRGFAVQSGIENTYQLKLFLDAVGSTRDYILGASMGGSITIGLIEKYPDAFAGALAACGVMSDWQYEVKYITDFRAVYNYFTRGTAYALPGSQDVRDGPSGVEIGDIVKPVGQLFFRAKLNPNGQEARLIRLIASSVPDVSVTPDLSTFLISLSVQLQGLDDINATAGGIFVSNKETVYRSPLLNEQENAALNAGVQRYDVSSPEAVRFAATWYSSTGSFKTKLLSYHNTSDPLVPFEHQARLRARVQAAGNTANLVQQTVQPSVKTISRVLFWSLDGVQHCGFTPQQNAFAFNELRQWVETGQRPQDGLDITDVKAQK